ncbi:hypothetical protein [Hymenobacter pini]|uniref:hypothetical protein n=1 Tax=Hymenobacter pini TaxID=2880879 RepID=UPI001CF5D37D|nr:hypothetical protein [Hymenobacter pini]MCA8830318.1 hypothetical protein [Hymenobacter pini]
MEADIILNGESLELRGNVVAMDNEISSTGPVAGFSFRDRSDASKRFVLYANTNKVRLWKEGLGDVLTVADKTLAIDGVKAKTLTVDELKTKTLQAGAATAESFTVEYTVVVKPGKPMPNGGFSAPVLKVVKVNLLDTIQALQNQVAELEKKIGVLQ